jgi:hypothetical protein
MFHPICPLEGGMNGALPPDSLESGGQCDQVHGSGRVAQILVDSRVRAAIEGFSALEPVGELTLKGFNRPVRAFNLTGVH